MNKNFFKNKSLLLTGGTGSFGKAFVNYLLKNKIPLKKIIIFSRDELKQFEMNKIFNENQYSNIRYFIVLTLLKTLLYYNFFSRLRMVWPREWRVQRSVGKE